LAVPNAYGVEKGNKLQRFLSRWKFMQELKDHGILRNIMDNEKKIHFLGMVDGPNEILLVKQWLHYIDTWDSSAAVWAGLNGVEFDGSPSGLVDGKLETEVHFEHQHATPTDLCRAMRNINFIDEVFINAENR
jgi:valyl-tRNA synthetase